jgi:hypothetical protein
MSISEVFTFTDVDKLLTPGGLYSEEAPHSTVSTLDETPSTQEGVGEYYG